MNRRKIGYLIICILMTTVLFACSKKETVKDGEPFLYYLNTEKTGLIKKKYDFKGKEGVDAARDTLKEMGKTQEDIRLVQPIPEGLEVLDCSMKDSAVSIVFGERYIELSIVEETLTRAAIVQSLLQIDGVERVAFWVGEQPLLDREGNLIGFMDEDNFIQNTGSSLNSYQTATLRLYFANEAGDKLVGQAMDVKYSSNTSMEKLIVEKLLKGPKKAGLYPTINPKVNILGVTIKEGICYVNFDQEFLNGAYDIKPEIAVYSLVNSIVEGTNVGKVQISINGETKATYMEVVDLSQPLVRNTDLEEKTEGK